MAIIEEVMEEVVATFAAHYAKKITESGAIVTLEEIEAAIVNNWSSISRQASQVYAETIMALEAVA